MPTVLERAFTTFEEEGFTIYTGYNPYHFQNFRDCSFTYLLDQQHKLVCSQGISLQEIYFLETLFETISPKTILVIGNAFGWSAVILALLNPAAKVATIDPDTVGNALTEKIAQKNRLNIAVREGYSPQDVARICQEEFAGPVDCVFIDAIHEEQHQLDDFNATFAVASPQCVFLFHDVINWSLQRSFAQIIATSGLTGRLLTRTPSGMGIVCSEETFVKARTPIRIFSDDDIRVVESLFKRRLRVSFQDTARVVAFRHAVQVFFRRLIPNAIFKYIRPLLHRND